MNSIKKELVINTSAIRVWEHLTNPAKIAGWFWPNDFEPRVGSHFTLDCAHEGRISCMVKDVSAPRKLVYSFKPANITFETLVMFTLEEVGSATRLTLLHSGWDKLKPEEVALLEKFELGWENQFLHRLKTSLESSNGYSHKNYSCEVAIFAPASKVYAALTTPEGLKGWWTGTCEVRIGVGAKSAFRFGETYNVMLTEKLTPDQEVVWRCLEQFHKADGLRRADEWAATTLRFRLGGSSPSATVLHFEHVGLVPQLECYQICEHGWNHFLKESLKKYVETGRGAPYAR